MKPGDLVFFAGHSPVSYGIQLATFSLPGRGFSHVAIVGELDGRPLLYESTSFPRPPCVRSQRVVKGVQAHWPEDICCDPTSTAYYVPLRRELYWHELDRLMYVLDRAIGTPYDMLGAGKSGGFILKTMSALLNEENRNFLFCSELGVAALNDIGIMQTRSASKFSPNSMYRTLRYRGIVGKARRIQVKGPLYV